MSTKREVIRRQLGKNGPLVPRLGVGLMGASGTYGMPSADDVRLAFLDDAYNMGETFWDTGTYNCPCRSMDTI
jgi:aryl-alcohol dehydrogenase-like predicted oxidoreductase